jgi:hypothetical protein
LKRIVAAKGLAFKKLTRLSPCWMFVVEQGDDLWLAPMVAGEWLRDGMSAAVRTYGKQDEMYFKTGDTIPGQLDAARQQARQAGAEANRKRTCSACESLAVSVN